MQWLAPGSSRLSSASSNRDRITYDPKSGVLMSQRFTPRREFLKQAGWFGSAALFPGLPGDGIRGQSATEQSLPAQQESAPAHHIKFGVCGMSHDHIYGMVGAIQRGGGELVAAWGGEEDKLAQFRRRYPNVRIVKTQEEIIDDPSLQLVLSSQIPIERAPLGVRMMQHGKDYLSDKPGIVTLEQLGDVRRTIQQTGRIYAIMYSERLEVKAAVYAGQLIQQGAIGKVIQTINIAPHQVVQGHGDGGGGSARPEWRHPVRHRFAPDRPVSVLHRLAAGRDCGVAGGQHPASEAPPFPGFRR